MGLTRKRDLRDGTAVWSSYATPRIRRTCLTRSTYADVVVVAAGIGGAMIARALTEAGRRPLILDRRREARSTSGLDRRAHCAAAV